MVLQKNCPAFSTNLTGGELMTKIRVHEYAKQIDKSSKEVIEQLTKLNVEVTNHMSTLEGDAVQKLDGIYKKTAGQPNKVVQAKPQAQTTSNQSKPSGQSQSRPASQSRPTGKVNLDQRVNRNRVQLDKVNLDQRVNRNRVQLDKVNLDQQVNRNHVQLDKVSLDQQVKHNHVLLQVKVNLDQVAKTKDNQNQLHQVLQHRVQTVNQKKKKFLLIMHVQVETVVQAVKIDQAKGSKKEEKAQLHLFNHQCQEKKENYLRKLHLLSL